VSSLAAFWRQSAIALFEGAMSIQCQPERLAFSRFFVCEVWRLAVYPQCNYRFKQAERNGWLSLSEMMEREREFEPHSKLDRY
jgi:hypothetical protein